MKECVVQSLVAPGYGTLANSTGFSLKKDGSVSLRCVVTSQTNRHLETFLWITHLCLKLGQDRMQLWGWLCPHHLLCWRGKGAHGQLSCFHGYLSRSYFPVLHFFDWSIWIMIFQSTCVPVIWKKCKIVFSVENIYGPNFFCAKWLEILLSHTSDFIWANLHSPALLI